VKEIQRILKKQSQHSVFKRGTLSGVLDDLAFNLTYGFVSEELRKRESCERPQRVSTERPAWPRP
jgi:hypothetical protein